MEFKVIKIWLPERKKFPKLKHPCKAPNRSRRANIERTSRITETEKRLQDSETMDKRAQGPSERPKKEDDYKMR